MPAWKKAPPHNTGREEPEVVDLLQVQEQTTKAELEEALTHLARYAAHQLHHVDNSRWVRAHQRINTLLSEWEAAPV